MGHPRAGTIRWDQRLRDLWAVPADMPVTLDTFYAGIHPDDLPRLQRMVTSSLDPAAGGAYEVEFRLIGIADRVERAVVTRGRTTFSDRTAIRMIGICADVTAQRQAEAVLARDKAHLEALVAERTRTLTEAARELSAEMRRREELQSMLLQSQKLEALGLLTGGVAHDFNNVLQVLQGALHLLDRRVPDQQSRDLIRHGLRAADRGGRLIGQLMAFARREQLKPVATDLGALLDGTGEMIAHLVGRGVECRFDIAAPLWPVIVDPARLVTVLLNLAANARDAMPDGGVLTIALANAEDRPPDLEARDYVRLSIIDSGIGMDEETLRRATEPFFTTKPTGKGTGLGLASAYGFAVQSGGTLRLTSTPGAGTTVDLFLPRADVLPAEVTSPPPIAGQPVAALADRAAHGDATILLVEDDEGVRAVVAGLLRDLGYRVVEAPNGEMAEVLTHGAESIDMLVTDIVMPGATGAMLADRLRADRPNLPVLFITGHAQGVALDGASVLHKPFTDAALADAVLACLGRTVPLAE